MDTLPGVVPMIAYTDGPAAIEWLCRAFGFAELRRIEEGGRISHAELDTGHGMVMLATPSPAYEGPSRHRAHCPQADAWLSVPWIVDGVLVYVDDVDGHFERARNAGAYLLSEPEEGPPGRRYRVEDLEGHRWMFMERTGVP
jgi:uncharacterized glyoxalase superfamily protein PhnB